MLSEKAKSRAQQRFFGMVRATQKGEMENPSPEIAKVASSVSKSDVKKMASTKHKGLPAKIEEKVGGSGTLVRQGVKVGGKKGGRAVQQGTTAATAAGRAEVEKAKQGNQSKLVGSGKWERRGATTGAAVGGLAGVAIPDGPAMVAGEIAGGYVGSKIGGKIGRQIDKRAEKKKVEEAAFLAPLAKVALSAGKGMVKQKAKQVIKQKAANVAKGAIPQPNMNEGVGRAAIGAGIGAMVGGPVGAAVGGSIGAAMGKKKKKVTGGKKVKKKPINFFKAEPRITSSEGVVSFVKKGLERDKKAKVEKKIKDRKAVPYAALAAEHQPEGEVVENRMAAYTAGAGEGSPAARPTVSKKLADRVSRSSDEHAFGNRKKKEGIRLSPTKKYSGKDKGKVVKRANTTGRGTPTQYRKSHEDPDMGRYQQKVTQGTGSIKDLKDELSIVDKMLIEYSPNVTYQAKGGKKSGKLGKSSIYSLRDKDESKKDFRKSHVKDVEDGYVGKGHKPTPGSLKKEEVVQEADSLSATVDRWEAARQKRMKQRQSYERPHWIPRDQDHEDNWGSSKGEKKKPQKKNANLQNEAKVDAGKDDEAKEDARNTRRYGHVPYNKHGHSVLRRSEHRMRRGDKKRPGHKEVNVETGKVGKEIGEGKETAQLAARVLKDKQPCAECGSVTHVTGQCPKKDHGVTEGVMDIVNRYKKKKEEKKPQKAQDAGARARRVLKRREYQSKVSAIVPAELEDQKVWDRIKKIW